MNPPRARELSPSGSGAIRVIELAGDGAIERAAAALGFRVPALSRPALARLSAGGRAIDEALVWRAGDLRSELHLHGAQTVVAAVLRELAAAGFEVGEAAAGSGSIERRAARALAKADNDDAARVLLDQTEGALRRELTRLGGLDPQQRRAGLDLLLRRSRLARHLFEPARVVLAGPVNAGKSTLFNAWVGEARALVDAAAGTTRDLLVETARAGIWPIELVDTAGERELSAGEAVGQAAIERAGQALAVRARDGAALVLWLSPVDADPGVAPPGAWGVGTCADRVREGPRADDRFRARISAATDPAGAVAAVSALVRESLGLPEAFWRRGEAILFDASWIDAFAGADGASSTAAIERLLAAR